MRRQATGPVPRTVVPHRWLTLVVVAAFLAVLAAAGLAQEERRTVRASGKVNNSPQLLIDGSMPDEAAAWDDDACVWWGGKAPYLVVDLGRPYRIDGLLLQVDHNDTYRVDGSLDGRSWKPMLTVDSDFGEVDSGMDTMSTDPSSPEYVAELKLARATVRYLRVLAVDGDDAYSISELAVTGEPADLDAAEGGADVTGSGEFHNRATLMTDGRLVDDGSDWDDAGCVWWRDPAVVFVIDLGEVRRITGLTAQVDHNDDYQFEASVDGKKYSPLLTIPSALGEGSDGLDTFSTLRDSASYVAQLKIRPQQARYVRLRAAAGDAMYAVAEVQVK